MAKKPSIAQLIQHLGCIREVDMMLREGVSGRDVARFIQGDQQQLESVNEKTLANALNERKKMLLDEAASYEEYAEVVYEDEKAVEDNLGTPVKKGLVATLAKNAYKRTKGGIKEHLELEALYIAQRARIDRLIDIEDEGQILMKQTGDEIIKGATILSRLTATKKAAGLVGVGVDDDHVVGDFEGLSKSTSEVLQKPESRHKVLSLVDRLAKRGKLKYNIEAPEEDEDDDRSDEVADEASAAG
jgi:hypothetical protein